MNIRLYAPFVESPRFTIFHVTVEVVVTCRANNPELLILKFHKRSRRRPRCFDKIRNDLVKVRVGNLVRVTSAKFWMKLEDHGHNGIVERYPPPKTWCTCKQDHRDNVRMKTRRTQPCVRQYIVDWPWFSLSRTDRQCVTSKPRRVAAGDCTWVPSYPPVSHHWNTRPSRQAAATQVSSTAYFSKVCCSPFLILFYGSPLARVA